MFGPFAVEPFDVWQGFSLEGSGPVEPDVVESRSQSRGHEVNQPAYHGVKVSVMPPQFCCLGKDQELRVRLVSANLHSIPIPVS